MRDRPAFTLIEILVALAVVALLVALLLPVLGERLRSADATQTVIQLEAIGSAARQFRLDVGQWPHDLAQLADPPGSGGASRLDVHGQPLGPGEAAAWAGPYLNAGRLPPDMEIPGVGTVRSPFLVAPWGGDPFFAIAVSGVSQDAAERIQGNSARLRDRVRWRGDGEDGGLLIYMVDPVGR